MNYRDLQRALSGPLPSQLNRAIRLKWGARQSGLEQLILPQRIDIEETLCGGIDGSISCVSTTTGIPLNTLIGAPLAVQLVTDRGDLHSICGIVTDACEGESDGALAAYRFLIRDALSIFEQRRNTRIFRKKNVIEVVHIMMSEWCRKSSVLGGAFYFDICNIDNAKYPVREQFIQFDESDAAFIRRLLRRDGIGWFIRAGKPGQTGASKIGEPAHTLVLYDSPIQLRHSARGSVAYRLNDALGERDVATSLCAGRQLVSGAIRGASWDHKQGRADRIEGATRADQGQAGNDLAQLLMDSRIDSPHVADSWADYDRLGLTRVRSHDARFARVEGTSGIRDLAVGEWIEFTGYGELDRLPESDRRITITRLRHRGENNLPRALNERALKLFEASRWPFESPPVSLDTPARPTVYDGSAESRYENTFAGVPHGMPLTPPYDPRIDLPRVYPIAGIVATPEGEEIFCDEYARINVQLQGLAPEDHEHANGMGTNGTESDSAAVRVLTGLAGENFGENWLPRKGMEVLIDFLHGDPDKMYVAGVFHNGLNMPATFTHTGSLPGNRNVSGVKTREVRGTRYNQLRFDDTPEQISVQLGSEHAVSELNLGYLTHPRTNGVGASRGEGAELRTDAAAALRAPKGILLTTYGSNQASGHQLERDELDRLLTECRALCESLGDYAGQHGGMAADVAAQGELAAAVKHWDGGSTPAGGDAINGNAQGIIACGAAGGSVNATPKTKVTYAGENIDQVAQQHVQVTSGQRINLQAGHGVAMFAHAEGISAIANQGKVTLQSQADDTQIDSAKNIELTAAGGKLAGVASDEVVFVTSGGAYLKLRGGEIELGCPGKFTVKSAGHVWGEAASISTDLPKFDHAPLGRSPQLVRATDGEAARGYQGEVRKTAGDMAKGQTDTAGKLSRIIGDRFVSLVAHFFKARH